MRTLPLPSTIAIVCLLFGTPAFGADYFAQTAASLAVSDVNGAPLPAGAVEVTFVETGSPGPAGWPVGMEARSERRGNGFNAIAGLAGTSAVGSSSKGVRWLGGLLVESRVSRSVRVDLSYFSVAAGRADTPEQVASAAVMLDLVVGRVDAGCVPSSGGSIRNLTLDCFDVILRVSLDDVSGVALPNFLTHSSLPGDAHAAVSAFTFLEDGGVARQEVVGIAAGAQVLIGLQAAAMGSAAETGVPHCFGRVATMIGTEGPDDLRGTRGDDVILGLGGDDRLNGLDGDDRICGGDGDDRIIGHNDDDMIAGEAGNDKIDGYYGDDFIMGGPGDDFIQGCSGIDVIEGGPGNDTLRGERGDDTMSGGPGNDDLKGAAGRDVLVGGEDVRIDIAVAVEHGGAATVRFDRSADADADELNGDRNDDILEGGPGADIVKGGTGHDLMRGGSGVDVLIGGGANDTCVDADGDTSFSQCESHLSVLP